MMRAMMKDGKEMPPEVKTLIRSFKDKTGASSHGIAPIP
jgi:hypothetical protein